MTRCSRRAFVLLAIGAVPALGSVRAAAAQDDAAQQLEATTNAMLALDSFHFDLTTTAGTTSFEDAFELRSVSGDIDRPDRFQAAVEVKVAFVTLTLDVIGIGSDIWVKNPLGNDDAFIHVTGGDTDVQLPPTILLNPDRLVREALGYLENPAIAGTETVDGEEMTVLTGSFDPMRLIGSGTPVPDLGPFQPAQQPLEIEAWIDSQDRLVRIDFIGPIFGFEEGTGRLVRSIELSEFDAPMSIEPPA